MEIASTFKRLANANLQLTLIHFPSGKFGFVGSVPEELAFIDATPEQIKNGRQFGGAFGPKIRTFVTAEAAVEAAAGYNFDIKI